MVLARPACPLIREQGEQGERDKQALKAGEFQVGCVGYGALIEAGCAPAFPADYRSEVGELA